MTKNYDETVGLRQLMYRALPWYSPQHFHLLCLGGKNLLLWELGSHRAEKEIISTINVQNY